MLSSLEGTSLKSAVDNNAGAWKLFSIALLAVITALGIVVTDVGFVVSLQGSLLGAALCFTIPSLILVGARKNQGIFNGMAPWKGLSVAGVFLLAFGTVITCLETFTTLLE